MSSGFYNDSIFWVEVEKIHPNPYQPRKEFDQQELQSLADSIRQYGVLQALVVTRNEESKHDGGLQVTYELISGERRLRASKLAGVKQVPVIIRTGDESKQMKLELAIIENIQREDLNVVDRARAFQRLIDEFSFSHQQVANKVGKSREYITNNLRVLTLPQDILDSLSAGKMSEGHARPLMMLKDKPEEQQTLHKEIIYKKMSVREAERIARKIAHDRARRKDDYDPKVAELEQQFARSLGTRVHIEKRQQGGKLTIDYFSEEDLENLLGIFKKHGGSSSPTEMMEKFIRSQQSKETEQNDSQQNTDQQTPESPGSTEEIGVDHNQTHSASYASPDIQVEEKGEEKVEMHGPLPEQETTQPSQADPEPAQSVQGVFNTDEVLEDSRSEEVENTETLPEVETEDESTAEDDRSEDEKNENDDDLYSIRNFSL